MLVEDLENWSRQTVWRRALKGITWLHALKRYRQKAYTCILTWKFRIEKAHCSPGSCQDEDQPLRLIMIRLLRSTVGDKVLKATREKGGVVWNGCNISLFPDMTKDLAERRITATAWQECEVPISLSCNAQFPVEREEQEVWRCNRGCQVHRAASY